MAKSKDVAGNMILASLDQDWSASVEKYGNLSQHDRGVLGKWLMQDDFRGAPDWVISRIRALASIAFLQTGYQWGMKQLHGSDEEQARG